MKVQLNGMTYDDSDARCTVWIGVTQATMGFGPELKVAFVTCVDDSTRMIKRYWGVWSWDDQEQSISNIMNCGGKWPIPFGNVGLEDEVIY